MKLLSLLLRASPGTVVLVFIVGSLAGLSHTGLLATINAALNNQGLSRLTLASMFIGLCITALACRVVADTLLSRISQESIFALRMQLSRQILDSPLSNLEKIGGAGILTSLTDDVSTIANALAGIPPFFMNIATLIGCLAYLGWLSWPILIGLMVFLGVGVLSYQLIMNRAMRHFAFVREHSTALYRHFSALTNGTKELKIHRHRRQAFLTDLLRPTAIALKRYTIAGTTVLACALGWGQLLILVFIGLLLFMMPASDFSVLTGSALVTIFLMTPIESILNTVTFMSRANISVKKIEELGAQLSTLSADTTEIPKLTNEVTWNSLELSGVTHEYKREGEERSFMIGPIDLAFHPGELVFLVGGNGSGKTTFMKCLSGLYRPEAGEIKLDGKLVSDEDRDDYRQLFSVVFSDFFLFQNLLGVETGELDAEVHKYLKRLRLDHKVTVNDGQFSTIELSQGQRKRLALLTAYLEDRPIYIFDEWAADQDPMFKQIFYCQLLPELKARGKLALVISHDDHYYHVADRIIKIDDGKIEYDKTSTPLPFIPSMERGSDLRPSA